VKQLIQELTETYGPSGHEDAVRKVIKKHISGHVDEMRVDALGNLIALRKGRPQKGTESRRIMLAAHMDEIGVIISYLVE
jgi:putative aminopeptidase FrvX